MVEWTLSKGWSTGMPPPPPTHTRLPSRPYPPPSPPLPKTRMQRWLHTHLVAVPALLLDVLNSREVRARPLAELLQPCALVERGLRGWMVQMS